MQGLFTFRKAKARVTGRKHKPGLRFWQVWPLWLICGSFVVLGVAALISVIREGRHHKDDVSEVQLATGEDLRVALDWTICKACRTSSPNPRTRARHPSRTGALDGRVQNSAVQLGIISFTN